MSSRKAPSEGQKVNLGQSAPISQEGTGHLDSSLAADSARSGGVFSGNRVTGTERQSGSRGTGGGGGGGGGSLESQEAYGGAAPTYVQSQFIREPGGPHGKNLQEGGFEGSGLGKSIDAEPGSKKDPGRRGLKDAVMGQVSEAGAGPRQYGTGTEGGYDVLEEERPA